MPDLVAERRFTAPPKIVEKAVAAVMKQQGCISENSRDPNVIVYRSAPSRFSHGADVRVVLLTEKRVEGCVFRATATPRSRHAQAEQLEREKLDAFADALVVEVRRRA